MRVHIEFLVVAFLLVTCDILADPMPICAGEWESHSDGTVRATKGYLAVPTSTWREQDFSVEVRIGAGTAIAVNLIDQGRSSSPAETPTMEVWTPIESSLQLMQAMTLVTVSLRVQGEPNDLNGLVELFFSAPIPGGFESRTVLRETLEPMKEGVWGRLEVSTARGFLDVRWDSRLIYESKDLATSEANGPYVVEVGGSRAAYLRAMELTPHAE